MTTPSAAATARTKQLHVWSPPQSALRVEYAPSLFAEALLTGRAGLLYGTASDGTVRVLSAHPVEGLDYVGIFSLHERGEIFLSDDDLHWFEQSGCDVALVIAGANAGFFVREPDGSIRSIKSHQEIPCPPLAPRPRRTWPALAWPPIAALGIAASFIIPSRPSLSVIERSGQIQIKWTRTTGTLEILDGPIRTMLAVVPPLSSITYAPQNGDVKIFLTAHGRVIEPQK